MTSEKQICKNAIATIERSLFQVAEASGDITPLVYADYFAHCEGSEYLMLDIEDREKGRMMDEVFRLLLVQELRPEKEYLRYETKNHQGYGVELEMYEKLFNSLQNTVKRLLGSSWLPEFEEAWQFRITELLDIIKKSS
ncbi:MAG: hypothetical protein KUG75_11995 [Pseudomonadales bacterium]|nr:hypothetical protein [Pseudomonadales bacterium]